MMTLKNAVWLYIDEENENLEGKWIPRGYVYCENVVDASDRIEIEDAFNDNTIEIVQQVENSEFTHIVQDSLGNYFAVTVIKG
ncbi:MULTISPECIES: hypothetical protein [unclassified Paenibacillus]|uniref:hypothetical protein n=1 Tax=unclassified Paenibacillus TaxID=185978 RepID=UPI0009A8D113|nr:MULTISPECIES: hypothetical protein [unclassified Paenibacillus]SLK16796.1 hypothetical protein SAMN06272722_110252 [Paenibacillus sp. RU5A]SOC74478.1 hypothetical protein SAMN05880581_110252 [Paenibacillus sp. RU26A]SOC76666.1 hypothetical protein SAMN05880586_110252 [Paenibacillus sp. RU5M]